MNVRLVSQRNSARRQMLNRIFIERLASTLSSPSVLYKVAVRQIRLPGDRGKQREAANDPNVRSLDHLIRTQ